MSLFEDVLLKLVMKPIKYAQDVLGDPTLKEVMFTESEIQGDGVTNHDSSHGLGIRRRLGDFRRNIEKTVTKIDTPYSKQQLIKLPGTDLTELDQRQSHDPNSPYSVGSIGDGHRAMHNLRRKRGY